MKQLNDYSIRFRQYDNINNLETLLKNAFVESNSPSTAMEIEIAQNNRQIKRLNFLNNDSKLISDQVEVKIFYDTEINSSIIVLMRESVGFRTGLPNPNYRNQKFFIKNQELIRRFFLENQDVFPKNWR
jgi:hypothetical protein